MAVLVSCIRCRSGIRTHDLRLMRPARTTELLYPARRTGRIRTGDPSLPKRVRCQAAPRSAVRTPGENRTPDTRIRNPVLCPLSYRGMTFNCMGATRAATGTRTRDLRHGKTTLSQLSYNRMCCYRVMRVLRRPSGGRTRSSGVRVQGSTYLNLTGAVRRAFRRGRTGNLAGFNRALSHPSSKGVRTRESCVDKGGFEPPTSGVPYRRATNCATSPLGCKSPCTIHYGVLNDQFLQLRQAELRRRRMTAPGQRCEKEILHKRKPPGPWIGTGGGCALDVR